MTTIPLQNLTALNQVIFREWMTSAKTRGTADILYSCLFTIFICVYTAVHLNIPPLGENPKWQMLRKLKWVLIGIFAPEAVLFTAWWQFVEARLILQCARKEEDQQRDPSHIPSLERSENYNSMLCSISESWREASKTSSSPPVSKFDMRYALYAVMGGFAVNVEDMHESRDFVTLTPTGVRALAERGVLLHVDLETIKDKSKADNLAKILVALQVLWMVVQVSARAGAGYPVSILEVHTFIHVICATAMYILWFKKPLNIGEPTVAAVDGSPRALLANSLIQLDPYYCTYERPCKNGDLIGVKLTIFADQMNRPPYRMHEEAQGGFAELVHPQFRTLLKAQVVNKRFQRGFVDWVTSEAISFRVLPNDKHCEVCAKYQDIQLKFSPKQRLRNELSTHCDLGRSTLSWYSALDRAYNSPLNPWHSKAWGMTDEDSTLGWGSWTMLGFFAVQAAYAAVHAAVWNHSFPTVVEMWMWRASCIYLASAPLIIVLLVQWDDHKNRPSWIANHIWLSFYVTQVLIGIAATIAIISVVARAYLVVESLLSLRAVPIGVYAAVPWSSYIPHF